MSLLSAVLIVALILFVREEILSAGYRREIKRAQEAYELSLKNAMQEERFPALSQGGRTSVQSPSLSDGNGQDYAFFDAA